jgi:hypothetical protein
MEIPGNDIADEEAKTALEENLLIHRKILTTRFD